MVDPAETDPGRFWRCTARVGALLAAGFLLVLSIAPPDQGAAIGKERLGYFFLYVIMLGLSLPAHLATAIILFFVCTPRLLRSRLMQRTAAAALLLAWIATVGWFYFVYMMYLGSIGGPHGPTALAFPHVVLFLCALTVLAAKSRRGTIFGVFWLGVVPLVFALVSWIFRLALDHLVERPGYATWGLVGAVLMTAGWFMWWRAVRRAVRSAQRAREAAADEHS
jgi:hypothetical protein